MRLPTDDFGAVVGPPLHERENLLRWLVRTIRETANPNTMHTEDLTPVELEKQASFESLDYYKPYPDMYVEYLRESHKNRRRQYMDTAPSSAEGVSPVSSDAAEAAVNRPTRVLAAPTTSSFSSIGTSITVQSSAAAATGRPTASPIQQVMTEAFPILQMDKEERHAALRWLLHVLIALSVGTVATFVSYAVDFVEQYRADVLYRVMTRDGQHSAAGNMIGFVYTVTGSVLLVAVAAGVVVYFEPAASGGGIPDVMAYLNGVHLRKAMNLRTFIAKTISCICAVSGGLPVGLEAPLIHLGAITGAGVTQGRSRTLGFQTKLFQAFRNNKDRRDFITAGAACGVSVAFGAPIGGLLFVMEEVCSFWDQSSSGQIFLATMLCFTFSTIINSIVEDRRLLGWVSNAVSVLFEVNLTIPLNLVSIVPSLLLGFLIGSIAAFFTKVNLILIKWRRRVLRPYQFRRFLEPVMVGAIFSACVFAMSLVAPCTGELPISDVNGTIHIWGTERSARLFNNTCAKPNTYSPLGTLSMASGKNTIRRLFSRQTAGEFAVVDLVLYFFVYFGFSILSSGTAVAGGLVVPSLVMGAVFGRLYGLLLFKMGAKSIPGIQNSYPTSNAWMDPGVFALIGAGAFLAGTSRMTMAICVIMVELSAELHYLLPVMVAIVMSKSTADWLCEPLYHQMLMMDHVPYLPQNIVKPEFEQLTAADVMATEVVMLRMRERTETVLAALCNSTHHAFPVVEAELDELLGTEVVEKKRGEARRTLNHTDRQPYTLKNGDIGSSGAKGTPQNRTSPNRQMTMMASGKPTMDSLGDPAAHVRYKFVGLVTREDLQVYFSLPQLQEYDPSPLASDKSGGAAQPVSLSAVDSDGFGGRLAPCVLAIRKLSWQQWMSQKSKLFFSTSDRYEWVRSHNPGGAPSGVEVGAECTSFINESRLPPVVDLSLIVNRSPWVIPPFFNLQMAYHTFRMMGLRHMVVVDGDTVAGMITRKDLLVDSLRRRMKELSARLAVADSAAPSLPPSHTNRSNPPHLSHCGTPRDGYIDDAKRVSKRGNDAVAAAGGGEGGSVTVVHGAEEDLCGTDTHTLRVGAGESEEGQQEQQQHSPGSNRHPNYRATASAWAQLENEATGKLTSKEEAILSSAAAAPAVPPDTQTEECNVYHRELQQYKPTSPLSWLFGSSSTAETNAIPGVGVVPTASTMTAAAEVGVVPSPLYPPLVKAQLASICKESEANATAAVTQERTKKQFPSDAEALFNFSLVKLPPDPTPN